MNQKRHLVWFRNDLRLHDNETVFEALKDNAAIYLLYCFDPRWFQKTKHGFFRCDQFRAKFLIESVECLKLNLQKHGSDLIVRIGNPEEIIPDLVNELEIDAVYCQKEVCEEEIKIENSILDSLSKAEVSLKTIWTSTLLHLEDLPYPIEQLPDIFTNFRKSIERKIKIRSLISTPQKLPEMTDVFLGIIPKLMDLGFDFFVPSPKAVLYFSGGEDDGLKRLNKYFWEDRSLSTYKETRNELLGAEYSSKFSPWLSLGCLSPRYIYHQIRVYEENVIKNDSTYWLIFELLWRDYFRFVAKKFSKNIFFKSGIRDNQNLDLLNDKELFDLWKEGRTNVPFVDASMIELQETGFMSNRGRQIVASFLVHDFKVNWTWGAAWFESQLIDYDVCSNWCNWNYIAGVGNDPRENRYFNIDSQVKKYDPDKRYIDYWLKSAKD